MPHETPDLTGKIIGSLFWVACSKGAQTLLQFIVLIILARLISPHDFGVISAAMIVIGFSEIINELGLEAAVIQRENLQERHLATAFTASLILSSLTGIIIYSLAPLAAEFFNSPQTGAVLQTLSILFPIRGLATVGEALAQREMRFRWLASRDAVSFGIGYFVFGVAPALLGYGVWAMVSAYIVTAAFKTAILLYEYPPKSFLPERRAFRELLYFGGGHTAARISNYLALQGDNIVVARTLDLFSLGIYGRAYQLMSVPASVFGQILDRVLFPSMAKIQSRKKLLAQTYLRGISLIAIVMLPLSVVGIVIAPESVRLILGDDWSQVILPFRILLIGLMMRTSYKVSDSLARATGAVYQRAWRQAIYAATVIGGAWVGHFWGVPGVAVGVLGAVAINFLLMAQLSLKAVGASWKEFLAAHTNAVFSSITLAGFLYPAVYILRRINCSLIPFLILTGFIVSVSAILAVKFAPRIFWGTEGLWFLKVLRNYLPKRFKPIIKNLENLPTSFGA